MSSPYVPTQWTDDVPGIQTGTPMSAANFNHMEGGILGNNAELAVLAQQTLQHQRLLANLEGEINTVTLTNSQSYPFNNSVATVSLAKSRDTLNYRVVVEVVNVTGGFAGDIIVSAKQLNGFKLAFDGSASSVTLKYYVEGGMFE